jgi:hypothetical protein
VQAAGQRAGIVAAFAPGQHHHGAALPDGAPRIGQQQPLSGGAGQRTGQPGRRRKHQARQQAPSTARDGPPHHVPPPMATTMVPL